LPPVPSGSSASQACASPHGTRATSQRPPIEYRSAIDLHRIDATLRRVPMAIRLWLRIGCEIMRSTAARPLPERVTCRVWAREKQASSAPTDGHPGRGIHRGARRDRVHRIDWSRATLDIEIPRARWERMTNALAYVA